MTPCNASGMEFQIVMQEGVKAGLGSKVAYPPHSASDVRMARLVTAHQVKRGDLLKHKNIIKLKIPMTTEYGVFFSCLDLIFRFV